MRRSSLLTAAFIFITVILMTFTGSCFAPTTSSSSTTTVTATRPDPVVTSVDAATSGTEGAYYAILHIKLENKGAEGTVLVIASVTQDEKTIQNEMPVYLMENDKDELKLTFPLTWKGGDWSFDVYTEIP
ncbi:MAG: hypothetical protein JXA46_05415 [Dehalococcoidales bacterium]|nr:hypothetical protein [Dehalococcoidales bacterium]